MLDSSNSYIMDLEVLIKSSNRKIVNTRKYLGKSRYVKLVRHVAQSKFFRRTVIVSVVLIGTYFIFPKPAQARAKSVFLWVLAEDRSAIFKKEAQEMAKDIAKLPDFPATREEAQSIMDFIRKINSSPVLPNGFKCKFYIYEWRPF
jgi:hypothetical protein